MILKMQLLSVKVRGSDTFLGLSAHTMNYPFIYESSILLPCSQSWTSGSPASGTDPASWAIAYSTLTELHNSVFPGNLSWD
jgi:hypothetical protein